MNVAAAARATGVSAKMIRYYERTGLIAPAPRTQAGYRTYSAADLHTLRFIRRARDLGFSIEAIRKLLALWHDRTRTSREVHQLAQQTVAGLQARIMEMQAMVQALEHLARHCHGDDRPDCPILDDLARGRPA